MIYVNESDFNYIVNYVLIGCIVYLTKKFYQCECAFIMIADILFLLHVNQSKNKYMLHVYLHVLSNNGPILVF